MAGTGRLWLPCLMCLTFSMFSSVNAIANCDIEAGWERVWWIEYTDSGENLLVTFNGSSLIEKKEGTADSEAEGYAVCENDETFDTDDGHFGSVVAYQNTINLKRFCFNGIQSDSIMVYRESAETQRTSSYTVPTCQSLLGTFTSFRVEIAYPFNFPGNVPITNLPLKSFKVNYKQGSNTDYACDWGTSYIEVTSNELRIQTCYTGTPSYELPVNSNLRIIGELSDERIVDLPQSVGMEGGILVLGYQDLSAPGDWRFYIARYGVDISDESSMNIYFLTDNLKYPVGYTDLAYIPSDVSLIQLSARSDECDINPCQNGGECIQIWLNYACQCEPGYAGRDCEEDVDDCITNPCVHGSCEDAIDSYICHCEQGWANTHCDVMDPCYVNPCQNNGECFQLSRTDFVCDCADGFTGRTCEFATFVDICLDSTFCENGGTCYHAEGSYVCVCTVGWVGQNCSEEYNDNTPSPTPYTGPSTTTPEPRPAGPAVCSEEGQECVKGDCVDYLCECDSYWTGPYCERVSIWFIVSIALIVLLALLLIIILVVCCVCCSGDRMGVYGDNDYNNYAPMESSKSEMSLHVNTTGSSNPTYDNVLY